MKFTLVSILYFGLLLSCKCQTFSVSAEKMNVFYVGVENPVKIAVENCPSTSLIIKTDNGTLKGSNGQYIFQTDKIGGTNIIVYKKEKGEIKEIGRSSFRVKELPLPLFKIGSGKDRMPTVEFKSQQFARVGTVDDPIQYKIEKFTVCVISNDTCRYSEKINIGNAFTKEIQETFGKLKPKDVVIFKNIIVSRPGKDSIYLEPKMITLY